MIHAFYSFSFIQLQFPSSSIKLVPQRFVLLYSNIGISKEIAFINVPIFSFSAKTILTCGRACSHSEESKLTTLAYSQPLACYICEFPFAFSYYCPTLSVLCANIIKNIEVMIIREHKLRKRVVFSLDMVSFRTNFCLQFHNYAL